MRSRFLLVGSALLASVLLLASGPAAVAGGRSHKGAPYKVKDLRVISGPSPFEGGCPGARFDDMAITGYELEPIVTVNPANPRNLVAAWKQDVGPANQSRSDLVASSLDGGKTWTRSTIPGLTACTGGTADAGSDPWLSAGGDGTVYFSGLAADLSTDPPTTAVVASRSRNGGRSWRAPVTVAAPLPGNETDAVTASPALAGHAYAVWANFLADVVPRTNSLSFSRTTDRGASWSPPVLIDQPNPFASDRAPRLLVLPDGTLLTIFVRIDLELGFGAHYAARSLDEGRTWLPAVQAGPRRPLLGFFDPQTGLEFPQAHFPSAAVAPDGTAYLAFEDNRSASSGAIGILRSRDGGRTWRSSTLPGVRAYAFEPAVAVDAHGTVGVSWYDLRNDRPGDAALTADVWFAHSSDRGRSWRQTHVAGPTDLRPAELPVGNYVGEYQGLAGLPRGRGFAAVFTLAAPQAKDGPTDIFYARIGPGR
jgi:hypothetical protein